MGLLSWIAGRDKDKLIDVAEHTKKKDEEIAELKRRVARVEGDVRVIRTRLDLPEENPI